MIRTIDIDWCNADEHPVRSLYGEVSDILSDLGHSVDLIDFLSGPEHVSKVAGRGITPELSDEIDNLIRDARFPFSLEKHLSGHFGESTGSSNVTSVKIAENMNIREVLEHFERTGQLTDALEIIEFTRSDEDPDAETILAYALAQYAKGWMAEQIITATDDFKKGSVSQDKGGIDCYFEGDETQIGSVTRVNSKKVQMLGSDIRHVVYQWDHGKIHVADVNEADDWKKMSDDVADSHGLSKTLLRRSHDGLAVCRKLGTEDNPRSLRYLWW